MGTQKPKYIEYCASCILGALKTPGGRGFDSKCGISVAFGGISQDPIDNKPMLVHIVTWSR